MSRGDFKNLREIIWTAWHGPGVEHVRVVEREDEIHIDGAVVALDEGHAVRGHYAIRCDATWRVRSVQLDPLAAGVAALHLLSDRMGRWTDGTGRHLPDLDGCIDIDLTLTPLTNTLPIRRHSFASSESALFRMAYIDGATLQVTVSPQRYTCLERGPAGARYRFEAIDTGFEAEIAVDADGLVVDYPPLFRRVWAK